MCIWHDDSLQQTSWNRFTNNTTVFRTSFLDFLMRGYIYCIINTEQCALRTVLPWRSPMDTWLRCSRCLRSGSLMCPGTCCRYSMKCSSLWCWLISLTMPRFVPYSQNSNFKNVEDLSLSELCCFMCRFTQ